MTGSKKSYSNFKYFLFQFYGIFLLYFSSTLCICNLFQFIQRKLRHYGSNVREIAYLEEFWGFLKPNWYYFFSSPDKCFQHMYYSFCIICPLLFIIHYPLSIIKYQLYIINYPLLIINYLSSIIHYPLFIIHYPLSIVQFSISI